MGGVHEQEPQDGAPNREVPPGERPAEALLAPAARWLRARWRGGGRRRPPPHPLPFPFPSPSALFFPGQHRRVEEFALTFTYSFILYPNALFFVARPPAGP